MLYAMYLFRACLSSHITPKATCQCHCNVRRCFRYGNPENYSTSTVMVTSDVSTGMAIRNITVPVLSSRHSKSIPVWSSPRISLPIMIYRYTHNVIKKLILLVLYVVFWSNTGKVLWWIWWPCFCSTCTGNVTLKNYSTGMGSVTNTVRGITGNVILRIW
jgi:hypothetical protein